MDKIQSISKGCFTLGPAAPATSKKAKAKQKHNIPISPASFFSGDTWRENFSQVWSSIDRQLNIIEENAANALLNDLVSYIEDSPVSGGQIPTAAILTGVNLPDHGSFFQRLESRLKQKLSKVNVAIVDGSDCSSLRHLVERTVSQLIGTDASEDEASSDDDEETTKATPRDQCNLPNLVEHFKNVSLNVSSPTKKFKNDTPKLVVILQDFETLAPAVVNRYIQILSGYRDRLPLVLVFGVATSVSALGDILDHKAISRLSIKSFVAEPSVNYLNKTLDEVFLNANCPFQLSGKLCKFFTDVFLFYDFSVNRFTQGIKYCVLEHFMKGGRVVGLLCCTENDLETGVGMLTEDDVDQIRMIPSFEAYAKQHDLTEEVEDFDHAKEVVHKLMSELRDEIHSFYKCLKILQILVQGLPDFPLGRYFRDLYVLSLSKDIAAMSDYKECRLHLGFMARDELLKKLDLILELLEDNMSMEHVINTLSELKDKVLNVGLSPKKKSPVKRSAPDVDLSSIKNRTELKKLVLEKGKAQKVKTEYEVTRDAILDYLMLDLLPKNFRKMQSLPLREIIYLEAIEDQQLRVVPRVRAKIHTALNNPAYYFMCDCCRLNSESDIFSTMPDVCIAYKLHLESGSVINMYDWLQSFNLVIKGAKESEEDDRILPEIQARFAQAVADLEFLGFIKSSTKEDHVVRLTWGSSS